MADTNWHLNGSSGSVTVHTGVAGRASRAGHRLTIEMREWSAEVTWEGDEPTGLAATVSVDSLTVVSGAGGLTPMTAAERSVARGNALKSLDADKFGEISYVSHELTATAEGFRADGTLTIHGRSRPWTIDLLVTDTDDRWQIVSETTISQKDFGIRPYSLMMGSLKVADEVRVVVGVSHAKQP
ncbi:MAG: YceI family protein [Actinomycetota bacterium]|nr:YceI family protein [Actinomycetota bacterium]